MSIGFRIARRPRKVDAGLAAKYKTLPLPNISDCMPLDEAEAVYAQARAKSAAEEKQMAAIKAGSIDRSWVDASLKRLGCEIAGGK
jgi:hypothetical protein